jgi:hypothetical protein
MVLAELTALRYNFTPHGLVVVEFTLQGMAVSQVQHQTLRKADSEVTRQCVRSTLARRFLTVCASALTLQRVAGTL